MNKRKAKMSLRRSKEDVAKLWTMPEISNQYMKDYMFIEGLFGKGSVECHYFDVLAPKGSINFKRYHEGYNTVIDTIIDNIDRKGLPNKGNFLGRVNQSVIVTVSLFIISTAFYAGYWFGERDLIPSTDTANNVPENEAGENKQEVNGMGHEKELKSDTIK